MDDSPRTAPADPPPTPGRLLSPSAVLDDQTDRWRRGQGRPVEDYLALHPELGRDDEQLLDLICQEMMLRFQCGEAPALGEYLRRFPRLAQPIRALFDVQ